MARRHKKRFGAVTGRRLWAEGFGNSKRATFSVNVMRGAGTYVAIACPKRSSDKGAFKHFSKRCGEGKGRTATSATANALRAMANKLK